MKGISSAAKSAIVEYLQVSKNTHVNDPQLLELLDDCSPRTAQRYLNYLTDIENILYKDTTKLPYRYSLMDKTHIIHTLSRKQAIDMQYAIEENRVRT